MKVICLIIQTETFLGQKKPNCTPCESCDVTFGSPAILSELGYSFIEGQNEVLRPVAFRRHLTVALAFSEWHFRSQRNTRAPSGAKVGHFRMCFHGATSGKEVSWLEDVDIILLIFRKVNENRRTQA